MEALCGQFGVQIWQRKMRCASIIRPIRSLTNNQSIQNVWRVCYLCRFSKNSATRRAKWTIVKNEWARQNGWLKSVSRSTRRKQSLLQTDVVANRQRIQSTHSDSTYDQWQWHVVQLLSDSSELSSNTIWCINLMNNMNDDCEDNEWADTLPRNRFCLRTARRKTTASDRNARYEEKRNKKADNVWKIKQGANSICNEIRYGWFRCIIRKIRSLIS